ncbi:preprotein translocase subunit SecY [Mycoplasma marinum]|uniref:Protein translocase subunit SecY n=1 Tax=Mycoplasma marinum TaxID=1937190 RepID=A0A4R0XTZ2_9MOLU|nr:preprotein translocase subunit SecY [Mycoplasma marinum]TCG11129.1 preprotein translocase subunit SecY [Mycoplasma marinum]
MQKKILAKRNKKRKIVFSLRPIKTKFKNFFRNKQLLTKILYTLLLLLIFRIAATITVPGVRSFNTQAATNPSSFLGLMDVMGGGAIRRFSIVALGISPYITASILMTILQSEFFPPIHRLANSGAAGRRKINIITRWLTLVFGVFQAITIAKSFETQGLLTIIPELNEPWFIYFGIPVILLSGAMFTLFLGEQITQKGVGNGTSLIIFSGVAVALPSKFKFAYEFFVLGQGNTGAFVGVINFIGYIALFLVLIFVIGYIYKSERHIPLQQTGRGLTKDNKQMSRLPIKVNTAGVMPVMFASLIVVIPLQIAQLLPVWSDSRHWIEHNMRFTDPIGLSLYTLVIFFFTIVMSILIFSPTKVTENFQKNGTFIPGIRPGDETEKYITKVLLRLAVFSAIYLAIICSSPYIEQILGMDRQITFNGLSLIILVTVSIETLNQIKTRGKSGKIAKIQKTKNNKNDSTGGLLW